MSIRGRREIALSIRSIFKIEKQESYFKNQMNGFNDPELEKFQFLSYSPMLKKELMRSKAEEEYIDSYIEAAKIIAENSKNENSAIKFMIKEYSLALPCIFLCRQALELSIKRSLSKRKIQYEFIHRLQDLWGKFEDGIRDEVESEDIELLENMKAFLVLIDEFDNDKGTKLRYSELKGGISQDKLVFVDLQQITVTTELFIKQLALFFEI